MKEYTTQVLASEDLAKLSTGNMEGNPLRKSFDQILEYYKVLSNEITYLTSANSKLSIKKKSAEEENSALKERVKFLEAKSSVLETQVKKLYHVLYQKNIDDPQDLSQIKEPVKLTPVQSYPAKSLNSKENSSYSKSIINRPHKTKSSPEELFVALSQIKKTKQVAPRRPSASIVPEIAKNSFETVLKTNNLNLSNIEFADSYNNHLDSVRFFEKLTDDTFITGGDDGLIAITNKSKKTILPIISTPITNIILIRKFNCLLVFGTEMKLALINYKETNNHIVNTTAKTYGLVRAKINNIKLTIKSGCLHDTYKNEIICFSFILNDKLILFTSNFKYCQIELEDLSDIFNDNQISFQDVRLEFKEFSIQNKTENLLISNIVSVSKDVFLILYNNSELHVLKEGISKEVKIKDFDNRICAISESAQFIIIGTGNKSLFAFDKMDILNSIEEDNFEIEKVSCLDKISKSEIEIIKCLEVENEDKCLVVIFSTKEGGVRILSMNKAGKELELENEISEHETHSKIFGEIISELKIIRNRDKIEIWTLGEDGNVRKYL